MVKSRSALRKTSAGSTSSSSRLVPSPVDVALEVALVVGLGIVSRARKRVTHFPIGLCVCLQSTCAPVNDNVMELLLMIRAFRRAHAKSITAVLPYFAYSRGDQRRALRTPIPASAMAVLLEAAEVDRVVGLQLHSKQVGLGLL